MIKMNFNKKNLSEKSSSWRCTPARVRGPQNENFRRIANRK